MNGLVSQFRPGRRIMLKWSGSAIMGALALGGDWPALNVAKAFAVGSEVGKSVDLGKGDVGILNYAYALEQLEAAFYSQVAKTPYRNMEGADRDVIMAIRDHELAHRDFLKVALKGEAIPALEVDFSKVDFDSRENVLSTALTFENLGVGAYNGAAKFLKKEEYLLVAGKIVSVEARHAAAIKYLLDAKSSGNANDETGSASNGGNRDDHTAPVSVVDEQGLDQAIAPHEVLSSAGSFVKTHVTAEHLS